MNKISVLGINFSDISKDDLQNIFYRTLENNNSLKIVTPNPEIVLKAKELSLVNMINDFDLVLKDGIGIKIAEKLKKIDGHARLTGIDTLYMLLSMIDKIGGKIYIVGAKDEILRAAIQKIQLQFKSLNVVGHHDGYFDLNSTTHKEIIEDIKNKNPDLVISAMGFPKQELFINSIYEKSYRFAIGCGGSLDVISGKIKRAPIWMQKFGLEWLYRLYKEPSRIKRQVASPKFIFKILFTKNSVVKIGGLKDGFNGD